MDVQFKYGELWQYKYKVGDPIVWLTKKQSKSASEKKKIKVRGVSIPCRYCVTDFIDFEIVIENNVVVSVRPLLEVSNIGKKEKSIRTSNCMRSKMGPATVLKVKRGNKGGRPS